ncbi:hypothetical protein [Gimesia fumaroli]|uniref:Uncharacterized protein n=1 Tax=Gimesia fumaroli TaxID=2527976 RepID=A0A518IF76_9PLAN|nr:hypothetical protein [Gimesia fumaroli]QDV51720.1 hypothetical protein Enr17x_37780 [Gimesia fumaroli]
MRSKTIVLLVITVVVGVVGYFIGASKPVTPPVPQSQVTNINTGTNSDPEQAAEPKQHLSASTIDLPKELDLRSQNGMAVSLAETEDSTDVLFLFYGEKHVSGAVRLTRILMRFPYRGDVYSTSTATAIFYDNALVPDKKNLDCLSGYIVLDRDQSKLEIDFVVKDKTAWHRFGWNGIWNLDTKSSFDVDEIMRNMDLVK